MTAIDRRSSLGYRPDRRHLLGAPVRDAAKTVAALPAPPPTASIEQAVLDICDQGGAPFCFANAPAQALRVCQVLKGVVAPRLASRLWLVYLTHAIENDVAGFDGGMIGDTFEVLEKLGFPPEEAWPYSDQNPGPYSTKPPADVFRQAFDRIAPIEYSRILSVGDSRIDDVKRAIAAGYPVVFGTQVTEAFCEGQLGPDFTVDAPRPLDAMAGGHALLWVGYDESNRFRTVNSWGPNWGDAGKCWMTSAMVTSDNTEDIWIVKYDGVQP